MKKKLKCHGTWKQNKYLHQNQNQKYTYLKLSPLFQIKLSYYDKKKTKKTETW